MYIPISSIYKSVTFLFSTADIMENAQRFYEICHVLLLVCTVTKAVKLLCRYWSRVFGCNLNPHLYIFFFKCLCMV
jgi:uncharacterized protein (DUF952 family)